MRQTQRQCSILVFDIGVFFISFGQGTFKIKKRSAHFLLRAQVELGYSVEFISDFFARI